jgi:hypothetical protein
MEDEVMAAMVTTYEVKIRVRCNEKVDCYNEIQ